MADQLAPVLWRAVNSNGDPVASAEANWFEAGTSTPLTVYQDEALTTPHAAPQVADASGIFDQVFIAAGTAAKVTVTEPSAGSTLYTIDPVPLTSTGGVAASTITFAPITDNAATNLQDAIANENARIDTNVTNIATNTSDIATNTAAIAAIAATAFEFISSQDASASATLDFTGFDATKYDAYVFKGANIIPSTDSSQLFLRTSTDAGSSYIATGYGRVDERIIGDGTPVSDATNTASAASSIALTSTLGNAAGEDGTSFEIKINAPHLAKKTIVMFESASFYLSDGSSEIKRGAGTDNTQAAVDAVRFFMSSGNIASGTITMYGLRNS